MANKTKLHNKALKVDKVIKTEPTDSEIVNYCVQHGVSYDTAKLILKGGN